ncbi:MULTISPECIES: arsenite methyltransferase [unclassified Tenacibaculum]|uniref:arsenite methyltransferase n=1 Tax=unclassified Tenacibaculum TaxID=2635139 RepID=UPI001F17877B|nr:MULTISPECIES: arsenite methyltransferase [unclassified Tenacibaculum]MCF2875211.1 arsenite methyltransferase [Tenacibaculum sp. Cn5-1]MCF2935287.1 arsenite methyltransferase [Tenacibaculum sp. Cn5-34]MCG7511271.1 arsenite methyltransferase [Tenacibaculum sp. Cn5-46]
MSQEIKEQVKEAYTRVANSGAGCGCGPTSCGSPAQDWTLSESYSKVDGYEAEADYALGCGIPTEHANIKEGNTVLDLGSGAGNDVFVARSIVGETGHVIGVDMTEAMIEKANENKQKLGYDNVDFILGEIEALPLKENSIDVAVSNCVLNLVPDKKKAYEEVYRVLKSGGHFSMSDIVLQGDLPRGIMNAAEMYAGCISGALQQEDYIQAIKDAGFKNIRITKEKVVEMPDDVLLNYVNSQELETFKASNNAVISLGVYAEK